LARRAAADFAGVHHGDTMGDARHDSEVVGDEDEGNAELALKIGEEAQDRMVTSGGVVDSSAMRRSGSHMSAIAIITRWRSPPES
jgi:hypothetical protein